MLMKHRRHRITDDVKALIVENYKAETGSIGYSENEDAAFRIIAERFACHKSTVRRIIVAARKVRRRQATRAEK